MKRKIHIIMECSDEQDRSQLISKVKTFLAGRKGIKIYKHNCFHDESTPKSCKFDEVFKA